MNKQLWITIFAIIGGAIVGYFGNVVANRENNALIVQLIKDQLQCVNGQIQNSTGRINEELILKRDSLQQQLTYYSTKFGIT